MLAVDANGNLQFKLVLRLRVLCRSLKDMLTQWKILEKFNDVTRDDAESAIRTKPNTTITTLILIYTAINFTITTTVVTANPINAISTTNSYRISSTIPTATLQLLLYFQLSMSCVN